MIDVSRQERNCTVVEGNLQSLKLNSPLPGKIVIKAIGMKLVVKFDVGKQQLNLRRESCCILK